MNRARKAQDKLGWLIGMLVISMVVGMAAPRVALAAPETPHGGTPVGGAAVGDLSLYMPLAQKDACTTLKSPGFGGFQVFGGAGFSSPYYKDLMESGASWIRLQFDWSSVEPQNTVPSGYNWPYLDAEVSLAAEQCWPIILQLNFNPPWASDLPEGPLTKTSVAEIAELMGAVAERYDGDGINDGPGSPQVVYFEMYNEPDAGASGAYERWGLHGDQYAAMLKAVYPAVKAANPQAKVVFGGIAYDSFTDSPNPGVFVKQFLEDVLKSGGGAYFDIMNYHFYPLFGWNWTKQFPKDGPGLLEKTAAIQAVLAKYNSSKPIIITETSWHSNKGASIYGSNTLQVRLLQQLFTQAKAAGVPMVAWWPIADVGGSYQLESGVVTNSESGPVTRKPSYYAYLVFVRELGTARFVAEISLYSDVKVYQFSDDARGRTIYVAWTNPTDLNTMWGSSGVPYQDTTRTTTIKLDAESVTVYDANWIKVTSVADGDDRKDDGKVTVTINGDPKYIVSGG
ncbi:MAG: cellulase family glycosylhydrolase [Caldilineaceae bacterium]